MPSNHLILILSIRVFSNELALCIGRPKYWSFSFSISPSNKYSGLIFFRIDWFNLLAIQGPWLSSLIKTLKSLIPHPLKDPFTHWPRDFLQALLPTSVLTGGEQLPFWSQIVERWQHLWKMLLKNAASSCRRTPSFLLSWAACPLPHLASPQDTPSQIPWRGSTAQTPALKAV